MEIPIPTSRLIYPRMVLARTGGVGAELAAFLGEEAFGFLRAPVRRVATPDTVLPASRYGSKLFVPQVADILSAARTVLGR